MFATLIPLFDEKQAVKAFSVFTQKENHLVNPMLEGTASYTGAGQIGGLEVLDNAGIGTLSKDADIFIPVTNISLFTDIEGQCSAPSDRIVLLIDKSVLPEDNYLNRIKALKEKGYRFAVRKYFVSDFEPNKKILQLMDFILLDYKRIEITRAKIFFSMLYPNIKMVAVNVDNQAVFDKLVDEGGYKLFEGEFYRLPVTKGKGEISPVKATYIELLNTINTEDFDLTAAADIIGRDTALVVSMLKMVNNMTINGGITSIRHAAAMLGQKELKKWINTAVTHKLCEDKPSELTRVSLIRAKFCENLAPVFSMSALSSELFLLGLFSVLDIILDKPMADALLLVKVSKPIEDALLKGKGDLAPILEFAKYYEKADWPEISRRMVMEGIDMDLVYRKYLDSLRWYRDLFKD